VNPVDLTVGVNEASDLLPVHSSELLAARGWRRAFWTTLDEGPVEECVALLGLPEGEADDGHWQAELLSADAGRETGRTEDGEALAYRDGYVYVFGSHFGSKRGPLRPRRAFVARFREEEAIAGVTRLEVVRNKFRFHRAINDALAAANIQPLKPGSEVNKRFIVETIERGRQRGKRWISRITEGDLPINIEGTAFTPDGSLLVGLRFPVTEQGEPLIIELADVEELFHSSGLPTVKRVFRLTGVTPPGTLTGIRGMSVRPDGTVDAVVGSIDALGKRSVLLDEHPEGGDVECRHVRFQPPVSGDAVEAEVIRELTGFHNVEGVAEVDGETYYVTDEDHRVALWVA